jgi:serpin B
MRSMLTTATLLLALLPAATPTFAADAPFTPATAGNAFGLDLYTSLRAEGQNLFFSPASIAYALAMTGLGARGATAAEMDEVLHLPADDAVVAAGFGGLMGEVARRNGAVTVSLANRLYGQRGTPFAPGFLALIERHFGAGLEQVDYRGDAEAARQRINGWVEDQTAQKIRELLGPGTVDMATELVLVNAVYFLGKWVEPFPKNATVDAPFHRERDGDVTTKFMRTTGHFGYAEQDGVQIASLPYRGGTMEMVVILPAVGTPLAMVEAQLDADRLAAWLVAPVPTQVAVTLPRLHLETSFELADALAALGMPTAFTDRADFTGMTTDATPLSISKVLHKAYLDVDEEGTEAAAATAVVMERLSAVMPGQEKTFRADRPFILAIRHKASGAILFLGRVANTARG